ncbi:MAG TPA: hypothetical protein VNX26_18375 [Candidatus Acidoferrum sp.]|nr:hypothetical protein [Candidatus Acidoferrum sp.]
MGLHIGGPDDSDNVVPQYQQWQQCGSWKVFENNVKLKAKTGHWIFVAAITYGNSGREFELRKKEFNEEGSDKTKYWNDKRIPTVFDIWLIDATSKEGMAINSKILFAGASPEQREQKAKTLPNDLKAIELFKSHRDQKGVMPPEDELFWMKNHLAQLHQDFFSQYQEDKQSRPLAALKEMKERGIGKDDRERKEMANVLMSPERDEDQFIEGYGNEIREELKAEGWLPDQIATIASNTGILQASFHEKKLRTSITKNYKRRAEEYKTVEKAATTKRTKFEKKDPAYKAMQERFGRRMAQFRNQRKGNAQSAGHR